MYILETFALAIDNEEPDVIVVTCEVQRRITFSRRFPFHPATDYPEICDLHRFLVANGHLVEHGYFVDDPNNKSGPFRVLERTRWEIDEFTAVAIAGDQFQRVLESGSQKDIIQLARILVEGQGGIDHDQAGIS